jgi:hypothetical protein
MYKTSEITIVVQKQGQLSNVRALSLAISVNIVLISFSKI